MSTLSPSWHKERRQRHWLMAATAIDWSSFLHSTNSLCFSSARRHYYVTGKGITHGFVGNATEGVLCEFINKSSKFYKMSSVLTKIMLTNLSGFLLWILYGRDTTISCLEKQTFAILEFYFRFRSRPFRRNLHVILHQAAELRPNRTTHCENMTHVDFSRWRPPPLNTTSGFVFVDVTAFRRSKSISEPNFVDISQFTAEIHVYLLPVWKNKRPPYWNSTSGFDLDHFAVICMLFCIRLPNFIQIEPHTAEIWRHIDFWDGGRQPCCKNM